MAIKLRLQSFGSDKGDLVLPIQDGETLRHAVVRILGNVRLDTAIGDHFHFLVNGEFIEPQDWDVVVLSSVDEVLVVPRIGGSANDLFRTAIIIAAAVYTGGTLAPALGSTFAAGTVGNALITAGVTSIVTALAYSAFPPPPLDLGSGSVGSESRSQMYAISSQSNKIDKLGIVPRVYGEHRMFPNVAANPYTELVADQTSKELVQDFYCIYDFGLGPASVDDIRIGDTPLTDFENYEVNFVDPNKPLVSEGEWDTRTSRDFRIYKGDVETESLSVVIDGNLEDSPVPPESEYLINRTTAPNSDNLPAEIGLTFALPQGLQSISSNGTSGKVDIDLQVEFQRVGASTSVWFPYNDLSRVNNFSAAGGSEYTELKPLSPPSIAPITYATTLIRTVNIPGVVRRYKNEYFGVPSGSTLFYFDNTSSLSNSQLVGRKIEIAGVFFGVISSVTTYSGNTIAVQIDRPSPRPLEVRVKETSYFPETGSISGTTTTNINYSISTSSLISGIFRISGSETGTKYASLKFTPRDAGQYRVRITRLRTIKQYSFRSFSSLALVGITTRLNVPPIVTDKRHVFMELRIRATNQLNGAIQNLSGRVRSVVEVYNGTNWVKQYSSNPAWVFCDILTGSINKRPLPKSRLHLPSIVEWANFCDQIPVTTVPNMVYQAPRFTCNMVMDYSTTVQGLINQITSAAQASLNIVDGKYGVLVDKLKTTPVQVFTPRNSSNFSSTKAFNKKPHALRVRYVDPENDWQLSELVVYADGYSELNATEIQDLNTFACTNWEQAYRFGRYTLAQIKLRQEIVTIDVDFEYLVCNRGDYVRIAHDVMKVGGYSARVTSVVGNRVTVDDSFEFNPVPYRYMFRNRSGFFEGDVTIVSADTFDLSGPTYPSVGDLIVIGETSKVYYDMIVKSITPTGNLGASLTLIEKADAIYNAENGNVIPDYNPGISQTISDTFLPPPEVVDLVVADNFWECRDGGYRYYIQLDWDLPAGSAFEVFEIYADFGGGYDIVGTTKTSFFDYTVPESNLGRVHNFKVLAVSATGLKLDLGSVQSVSATPVRKTTRPSDVEFFNIDITGEVLQLFWTPVADCDIREYLIRYSPVETDNWETSVPLLRVDRNTTLAATQARTGVYLIKAVDFNFNESTNAALSITTIPNLFNLNIIETTTDFPALNGTTDRVVKDSGTVVLDVAVAGGPGVIQYYPEGYYYYENFLDLGDIYTVRLQSKIRAEGYTIDSIMSNWATLSDVSALYAAGTSEWDVETQYRTTDTFNVMSDWLSLADIDPISEGQQDNWTPWRKIAAISDATGRIFQFRLKLISNLASVSPRVFDGTIQADMPDRTISDNNLTVPTSGLTVTYVPSFKGPLPSPSVQITIDDAESGDYVEYVTKSVDGFSVVIRDSSGNPVVRNIDYVAKGYGRKNSVVI